VDSLAPVDGVLVVVVVVVVPVRRVCGRGSCQVVRLTGGVYGGVVLSALVVGVYAGLALSALVVCVSWLIFLSLLATARGGASFLCPKRQRNEAKKTLSKRRHVSVHNVQF
jgi:hypothetical protein